MSKKSIIALITVIVLLFAAGVSVGVFLYTRGTTQATEGTRTTSQNQVADELQQIDQNQVTEETQVGNNNENSVTNPDNGDENPTTLSEGNTDVAENNNTTADNGNANANNGAANNNAADNNNVANNSGNNAGVTTGTDVNNVGETTIERIEEQEKLVSRAYWDWWKPMEVALARSNVSVNEPQITVKKSAITGVGGDKFVFAGQDITYVIAVTNNSDTEVQEIEITDRVPQNTTFVSIDDAMIDGEVVGTKTIVGTENAVAGVKWVVTIPAGKTVIAKFTVNVNETTGTISNVAIANGEESKDPTNNPDEGNETKTAIITSNKSSVVTRLVDEEKQEYKEVEVAKVGDLITYTITVENTGDVEGTTYIQDTIPTGTEFVSAEEGALVSEAKDSVLWSITLGAKETVTRTFTVRVKEVNGAIENTANVGGTDTNTDTTETAGIEVIKTATEVTRITLNEDGGEIEEKLSATTPVRPEDVVTYTITITNIGSLDIEDVEANEQLKGVDIRSLTVDGKAQTVKKNTEGNLIVGYLKAAQEPVKNEDGEIVKPAIQAGKAVIIATYTVAQIPDVTENPDKTIYNKVKVIGTTVPTDPEIGPEQVEGEDDETVTVEEAPSIKVEKTATALQVKDSKEFVRIEDLTNVKVRPGDVIEYAITVTNTGNTTLENITVTDSLHVTVEGGEEELEEQEDESVIIATIESLSAESGENFMTITTRYTVVDADTVDSKPVHNEVKATVPDGPSSSDDEDVPVNPDTSVSGTKTWVDGGRDHNNATEVTLTLSRLSAKAGSTAEVVEATPTWNGNTYTFSGLENYDAEGYAYTYTVTEAEISGYISQQNGNDFINTKIVINPDIDKKATTITTTNISGQIIEVPVTRDVKGTITTYYIPQIGDIITYEITATNNSNVVLRNISVTDESHDVKVTKIQKGDYILNITENNEVKAKNNLLELLPDTERRELGIGESYVITLEYEVETVTNIANIVNTAKITATADEVEGEASDSDDETVPVVQVYEGYITKTSVKVGTNTIDSEDERTSIKLTDGQKVTYEIFVENKGNTTLTNVAVTDDHNVSLVSIRDANGTRKAELEKASTSTNLLGKTTLTPGEKYTITVTYIVDGIINEEAENGDKLINKAYLTAKEIKDLDDDDILNKYKASNITQTKTSKVIGNADGDDKVDAGDIIEYTIIVKNTGNISGTTTVKDVLLKENINNKKIVMMLGDIALDADSQGNINQQNYTAQTITVQSTDTSNNTTTTVNTLAQGLKLNVDNGERYTITFRVKVGKLLPGQVIENKLEDQENTNIQNDVEATITVYKKLVKPQNAVIVIDCSLSMAEAVDYAGNSDPMADSYEETRWYALTQALDSFLKTYMGGTNNQNKVTIIGYNHTALSEPLVLNCTDLQTALNSYKNILTKSQFDYVLTEQIRRNDTNDVDNLTNYKTDCKLGSGTNIDDGLIETISILENNVKGAQVILMTDGEANRKGSTGEKANMETAMNEATKKATTLKNKGATLYTVSLSLGEGNSNYIEKLQNIASTDENGNKLSKSASTMNELIAYFKEISESISEQTITTKTQEGILYLSEEFNLNTKYAISVEMTIPNDDGVTNPITFTWDEFETYYNATAKTINVTQLASDKGILGITGDVSITINVDNTITN